MAKKKVVHRVKSVKSHKSWFKRHPIRTLVLVAIGLYTIGGVYQGLVYGTGPLSYFADPASISLIKEKSNCSQSDVPELAANCAVNEFARNKQKAGQPVTQAALDSVAKQAARKALQKQIEEELRNTGGTVQKATEKVIEDTTGVTPVIKPGDNSGSALNRASDRVVASNIVQANINSAYYNNFKTKTTKRSRKVSTLANNPQDACEREYQKITNVDMNGDVNNPNTMTFSEVTASPACDTTAGYTSVGTATYCTPGTSFFTCLLGGKNKPITDCCMRTVDLTSKNQFECSSKNNGQGVGFSFNKKKIEGETTYQELSDVQIAASMNLPEDPRFICKNSPADCGINAIETGGYRYEVSNTSCRTFANNKKGHCCPQ